MICGFPEVDAIAKLLICFTSLYWKRSEKHAPNMRHLLFRFDWGLFRKGVQIWLGWQEIQQLISYQVHVISEIYFE